jgi:hypothetical protein
MEENKQRAIEGLKLLSEIFSEVVKEIDGI